MLTSPRSISAHQKFLPHSLLLCALKPFRLKVSSVANAAIQFRRGSCSTRSCSMRVHCSTYQELASDSLWLTAHMLHIFVRPSGACAGHTLFCSIGTGVKQPESEAALYLRTNTKMKNKRAVTALTVRIVAVVKVSCALTCC